MMTPNTTALDKKISHGIVIIFQNIVNKNKTIPTCIFLRTVTCFHPQMCSNCNSNRRNLLSENRKERKIG